MADMKALPRSFSDDSVLKHVEVEKREKCLQSGQIRRRSRKVVSDAG
jgi:hypothetical protein